MESKIGQSNRRWLKLGERYAFLIRGKADETVINTRHSYLKKFWRLYRVGPGMPQNLIMKLSRDAALRAHKKFMDTCAS